MIFHSLEYVIFLVVVFGLYWSMGLRAQNLLLLAASWLFYGYAHPAYLSLLIGISLSDYHWARQIVRRPERRRLYVTLSLVWDFGALAVFKYFGFFAENVATVLAAVGLDPGPVTLQILLPVGISFYVFQSSAYVIDAYRGQVKPAGSFFDYALFVSFFPQLVAGPIERAAHLLAALQAPRVFRPERFREGFLLLLWGYFLKLVVADNTAVICNRHFSIEQTEFPLLWSGVFAFGVQIYADFWAYTAIARGTARLLGLELVRNFEHPYLARSPGEFWRRWHQSLSTWFRDYVYIPLGGSRAGAAAEYRNLFVTFLLSGLWHGASWNFLIWGAYHGILVAGQRWLERRGVMAVRPVNGWTSVGRWAATFVLIHVGWLFFREQNVAYLGKWLCLNPLAVSSRLVWQSGLQDVLTTAFYAAPLWLAATAERWWNQSGREAMAARSEIGRFAWQAAAATALFLLILLLGSEVSADFIYFQF